MYVRTYVGTLKLFKATGSRRVHKYLYVCQSESNDNDKQ